MDRLDKQLGDEYYDINQVGSYGGIQPLSKKTGVEKKKVQDWLQTQDTYTLHKQVRYKFPRRKIIVSGPGQQWQADLVDVTRLSRYNKGVKYILTCIDVFSKKAFVCPLKDKSGSTLLNAFKSINSPLPKRLQTDKGREFTNRRLQQWLTENRIHYFTTENEDIKASVVERFNKTLKSKLWRYFTKNNTLNYIDILQKVVNAYNHTPHKSIGMAPLDVNNNNKTKIWYRLYADPISYKEPLLGVVDSVRISKARRTFEKGYLAKWTEEIFTIVEQKSTNPPTFVLADFKGERLKGTFFQRNFKK